MMVILIGANRAHMIKIRKKDYGKHWVAYRGQLYKVYPDGMTRCFNYKWGEKKPADEIIVYPENGIIPYNSRRV